MKKGNSILLFTIIIVLTASFFGIFGWMLAKSTIKTSQQESERVAQKEQQPADFEVDVEKETEDEKSEWDWNPYAGAQFDDDIANWKTYQDKQWVIEFKYPAGYVLNNDPMTGATVLSNSKGHFYVNFYENIKNISSSISLSQRNDFYDLMDDPYYSNVKKISFYGDKAFNAIFTNEHTAYIQRELFVEHGGGIYKIAYSISSDRKNVETLEQILATFRFLDSAQEEKVDLEKLKAAVYDTVNAEFEGSWEKKIDISKVSDTHRAATGKWRQKDAWEWIAYGQQGAWKVLVSRDGFDCDELEDIPDRLVDLFQDVTHNSDGTSYCHY